MLGSFPPFQLEVPISSGLSGRGFKQTIISSSISKLGSGFTIKSILVELSHDKPNAGHY